MERFNLHKLTFTEAHIIIASFHKNLKNHITGESFDYMTREQLLSIIQKEMEKNIYWQLKEEIEKVCVNLIFLVIKFIF